ncbi:MAG: sulfotransferase family 2 domain-containing protein [Gammaproteobacteria bacterium]
MLCHALNCLFVHIPKTGGQTVTRSLLDAAGLDWEQRDQCLLRANPDPAAGPPRLAHLTLDEYRTLGYLHEGEIDTHFSFAFVRNPWARLVSEYLFYPVRHHSFREFVLHHFPGPGADDHETGNDRYRHILPQHRFVCDSEGRPHVDFIGRFENLEADFQTAMERLGRPDIRLAQAGNSHAGGFARALRHRGLVEEGARVSNVRRPDYRHFYDDQTRAFVDEFYAQDIALFGYAFDSQTPAHAKTVIDDS